MTDDETTQVPDALLEALAGLEGVEGPAAERATDDGMPTGMDLEARAEADPRSRIELIVAIDAVEAARQHGGVLDRHRRALRHVGRHRMAGIAEKRHLAVRPAIEGVAVHDRPFVHVGTGG